jgi:hypothetical protein
MIPSGYKDQKVYSVKPIDGSGDLTFSRASNASRINSSGLVEKVRTNLITYSEDFGNAAWPINNSTKTTSQSDPDGGTTAVKIVSTAVVNSGIYQTKTASSTTRTASLWMKGEIGGEVVEYGDATNRATATLTTSWVRYSFAATDASAFFVIYNQTSSPVVQTWYVAFAQYEDGDIATDYIATTSSAVSVGPVSGLPRLDYSGGATCPSLLLEPQRTNVLPQSNYFAAADWIKINGSIATNQATSPEGIGNASTFTEDTSSGFHVMYDNIVAAFSTAHTLSAFVKPNGRNIMYLRMENASTGSGLGITYFNISTGQILTDSSTSSSIEAYANGWYRVSITATTPSAQSTLFAIGLADVDNSRSYTGDGTSGIYLYGAQAEPSATYPTSLIPTNGTSVTRVGDIALKTSISSLIGQTEGTLFFDWIMNHESPNSSEDLYTLTMSDGTGNKIIGINNYNQTLAVFIKDTTTQFFDNSYTSGTDGARIKLALAYANNDVALYINGTQIATDSSATIPTLSQVRLNTFWNGNLPDSTSVNQLLLFKTRLTNADLATLTA